MSRFLQQCPDIYGDARDVAPNWDSYYLGLEWLHWLSKNETAPETPEHYFVKFFQNWFEKRRRP